METYRRDYCNNCGNYGHLYKNCRHPILSYGIILYNIEGGTSNIVMVERKDSLSYIEFIRGKYSLINNVEYLKLLFNRFSKNELIKVKSEDFDEQWNKLWIHTDTINSRIKREYKKSKDKFNKIKRGIKIKGGDIINIDYLVNSVQKCFPCNEWEIPKGRRKHFENNRECAIREFYEETNINKEKYTLFTNIIPLIEEYQCINGVKYKHVYYIGNIQNKCELVINLKNKDQYTEVKDIKWLSKEECLNKIRSYDEHKQKIINDFFYFLDNYKKEAIIEIN